MIYETFNFLAGEVNQYLTQKMTTSLTDPGLVLGNAGKALDNDASGTNSLAGKAILSLINVEEDRVAQRQENYTRTGQTLISKSPQLYLNLYALFSVNTKVYSDSLSWLAFIVQFFQYQNVFTPTTHPTLDIRIKKLIVDLYTMNFEQLNQLWSILGGKYIPSVVYKIRQITIDENAINQEGAVITQVTLNEMLKTPVS
jgi:hypothetical protein